MSAPTITPRARPAVQFRGVAYPVLLPTLRDPRLHLAGVIVSLHVIGQAAFGFRLSIAQILAAVLTSAALEVVIALRRQRVLLWPASALLTGNGVAFILRVPGTEHGDWWSLRGWWIFAGASAVALLSKYVIRFRGRHVFNPSNIGLVLCFLLLGSDRADPLEFWWGPMSVWLAVALALIVGGGLWILSRLRLLGIAVGFWLTFAASVGVLAVAGHEMTARWHTGPIVGASFWWVLVSSPEILVFLFFMITDPRTIPDGAAARRVYAAAVGVLSALLIAPQTTEFGSKVAVLGALAIVCGARPLLVLLGERANVQSDVARLGRTRAGRLAAGPAAAAAVAAALVLAGIPARPDAALATGPGAGASLPAVTVGAASGVAPIDRSTARRIAGDLVRDLDVAADALRRRSPRRATGAGGGEWLAELWGQIRSAKGRPIVVPVYHVERTRLTPRRADGQGPPTILAATSGTIELLTFSGTPPVATARQEPKRFSRSFELVLEGRRYLIVRERVGAGPQTRPTPSPAPAGASGIRLVDVAPRVGLDFRHGAFGFGVSNDPAAMMGGGLCWLDYDADGWIDLYAVNSHAERDIPRLQERGGLPRSALFRNVRGTFEDVARRSGTDLSARGSGCVAADFDGNGTTDLFVTTAGYDAERDAYDALYWNNGDGTFTEGARAAGINAWGWHAGAAVGDVNGDGRPDLFVSGYTDMNQPVPGSQAGFPTDHRAIRDLLYLNEKADGGRVAFREVGRQAGLEPRRLDHGLGAVFSDVDGDGRLDLYVANDEDPNRLYLNRARTGSALGFRFEDGSRRAGVDDANAGMGIAAGDFGGDGSGDLFVTNSRGQLHAVYGGSRSGRFRDARPDFAAALGKSFTGWGVSWVDLDLDGDLDLALANGAIPVKSLRRDAQRLQVIANTKDGFVSVDTSGTPLRNGRGLAAADYDNDGDVDVAINAIGGRLVLLENRSTRGNWVSVRLERREPGTLVVAVLPDGRRLVREVQAGSSYLSSEDPRIHFGLGRATRLREILVRYPDGGRVRLRAVAANRLVTVER